MTLLLEQFVWRYVNTAFPLCEKLLEEIITCSYLLNLQEKLINFPGQGNAGLSLQIGLYFNKLRAMLNVLLDFGNALLRDLLSVNRTVSLVLVSVHDST